MRNRHRQHPPPRLSVHTHRQPEKMHRVPALELGADQACSTSAKKLGPSPRTGTGLASRYIHWKFTRRRLDDCRRQPQGQLHRTVALPWCRRRRSRGPGHPGPAPSSAVAIAVVRETPRCSSSSRLCLEIECSSASPCAAVSKMAIPFAVPKNTALRNRVDSVRCHGTSLSLQERFGSLSWLG